MLKNLLNKKNLGSFGSKENESEDCGALNWRYLESRETEGLLKYSRHKHRCTDIEEPVLCRSFSSLSTNLLLAPKEITKLFHSKAGAGEPEGSPDIGRKGKAEAVSMDLYNNQENGSSTSDVDLSQEESFCNQELLVPKLRSRKLTNYFEGREYERGSGGDYEKEMTKRHGMKSVEGRRINVDVRKTSIANHPTIMEREIKVVKDKMLRMSVPRVENSKKPQILHKGKEKECGDTYKEDFTELTFPVSMENIKIPKKRELHRIIHHRLCNYINPDIMLIIEEHEFYCHRIVLQSYSKYFDNINNLQDDNVMTIKEKGVSKEAFIAIYAWMLSLNESGLKYITRENFVEVLIASQVLQIRDLEEQCLALIDSKEVFFEGYAYQLFKQAGKLDQKKIKELMVPRIQHFFLPFVSTQEYLDLSLEDVCTFLSSSYIVVHSEMEVFMSAARWLLDDWTERKQHLPKVMNCVRFGLMNPLELVDIRKNPESPEFLKVTEDSTIQKYIDDGLAYSTYCAMKGGTEELKYRCELFGLEIPQPRNWAESTKCYKSYGEFLSYLKQLRSQPLRVIETLTQSPGPTNPQKGYTVATEDSSFNLDLSSPLHTFTDGIPSMSDLLSVGIRNKAKRDKQKEMLRKRLRDDSFHDKGRLDVTSLRAPKQKTKQNGGCKAERRKEPSLKWRAATIIQAAYRGYRVRKRYCLARKSKETSGVKKCPKQLITDFQPQSPSNSALIRKSTSEINMSVCNESSQTFGSLYFQSSPSVLVLGGLNPQQELTQSNDGRGIFRYSLEMNKWELVGSLPRGRYYHNAAFLKGRVYLVGGVDPRLEDDRQTCTCSEMWSLNPSSGDWEKEPSMKTPRKNFGLVPLQGYLYAIGGQGINDVFLSSVERYDPTKRCWDTVCPLPEARLSPAVARFSGGIWVAGGLGTTSKPVMSQHVYSYDPRQNIWIVRPSLRSGRAFSALVVWDDRLFMVGGAEREKERGCSISCGTIDVFDTKNNKWEPFLQLRTPRHSHASAIIDNCLMVIGGTTTQQMKSLNDVEIWCLENKAWKRHVSNLPAVLTGHSAVVLPSASYTTR